MVYLRTMLELRSPVCRLSNANKILWLECCLSSSDNAESVILSGQSDVSHSCAASPRLKYELGKINLHCLSM